ncbi:MAG: response regulator [Epulopiscium sp.]|nr:response regulator [Candidatus Epulonipiscium sp.]
MLNIMIIDDEKDILEGMKYIINWEQHGYRVKYTFESSRKALAIALQEKPDLIITDIRMPGIDGLQLIAELKKHLKEIKFVILSGYDDFQYAKLAIEYGVNDYLLKPIDEEELINTLQRLKAEIHKEKQKKLTTQSMMRKLEDSKNIIEASAINKVIKGRQDLLEDSEKIIIQKLNNMNSHLVFIKMDRYFTNDGQYKCVNEEGFSVIKNLVVNEYNSIYFFEESQVGIFF